MWRVLRSELLGAELAAGRLLGRLVRGMTVVDAGAYVLPSNRPDEVWLNAWADVISEGGAVAPLGVGER